MATKLVFLSLLVLYCCVTLVSCKSASAPAPSTPPPVSPTQFVNHSCMTYTNGEVDLCIKDLTPFANDFKGDEKRLVKKALSICTDKIKPSINLLKKMRNDKDAPITDPAKPVDSCTMAFLQAAEQMSWVERSIDSALRKPKSKSDNSSNVLQDKVNTWLYDSRGNTSTCVSTMEGYRDTNWGVAYHTFDEVTNTIFYAGQLLGSYFSAVTPPPAPSNWADLIQYTCDTFDTNYASQWKQDMLDSVPKGAKMDNETVTYVAASVSVRNTDSLLECMNGMIDSKNHNTTQKDRQAARKCATELHKALTPLDKVANRDPKGLSDLPGFLQGFNVSGSDCLTSVRNFSGNASDALFKANYAQESNNIAIYLVRDHLKSKGKN